MRSEGGVFLYKGSDVRNAQSPIETDGDPSEIRILNYGCHKISELFRLSELESGLPCPVVPGR